MMTLGRLSVLASSEMRAPSSAAGWVQAAAWGVMSALAKQLQLQQFPARPGNCRHSRFQGGREQQKEVMGHSSDIHRLTPKTAA
jgi:hypothetical protein